MGLLATFMHASAREWFPNVFIKIARIKYGTMVVAYYSLQMGD